MTPTARPAAAGRLACAVTAAGLGGAGLLLAAEVDRDAVAVAAEALGRGLVVNAVTPSALRFAPPLLVTDREIDDAVAILGEVLR